MLLPICFIVNARVNRSSEPSKFGKTYELLKSRPGYFSRQGGRRLVYCDDYCEFLGEHKGATGNWHRKRSF